LRNDVRVDALEREAKVFPASLRVHVVVVGKLHGCETCKFIGTDCLVTQRSHEP